jgi:hypothetical protein
MKGSLWAGLRMLARWHESAAKLQRPRGGRAPSGARELNWLHPPAAPVNDTPDSAPPPLTLLDALQRALALYADPSRYAAVQRRGMARDFSWKVAAGAYERLYQESM